MAAKRASILFKKLQTSTGLINKLASASADKAMTLSEKAAKRASILQTSTGLINELKDEINEETRTLDDLKKKVGEYDAVIDWMEHEYEERCQEYETRIDSLKGYSEAIIEKKTAHDMS
jgi:hypothetical protein